MVLGLESLWTQSEMVLGLESLWTQSEMVSGLESDARFPAPRSISWKRKLNKDDNTFVRTFRPSPKCMQDFFFFGGGSAKRMSWVDFFFFNPFTFLSPMPYCVTMYFSVQKEA